MSDFWCDEHGLPTAADVYAGEGGVSYGLMQAGFCVTAVDNDKNRLKHNPAQHKVHGDAIQFIHEHGHAFGYNHGSPTCTGYSRGTAAIPDRLAKYDRLIGVTRQAFIDAGRPYTIENVEDAKAELIDPILLCGRMFGLKATDTDGVPLVMDRHRLIESSVPLVAPEHPIHGNEWVAGAYGGARRDKYEAKYVRKGGYVPPEKSVVEELLGIDWMTWKGLYLSIPPVYALWVGRRVMDHFKAAELAA
jgi:DNA (cytosine-5)-methyltransferase 1